MVRAHDLSDYSHLVPEASHAQTSFGLLYVWANDEFDYGMFIDDNTLPHPDYDFFGTHLVDLSHEGDLPAVESDEQWVNVLYQGETDLYPRGYPYSSMDEKRQVGSEHVDDVVASGRLQEQHRDGGLVGQRPQKENYVGLDPSTTDDHGNPGPEIHWDVHDVTKRSIRRANEIREAILSELGVDITWQVGPEATGPAFHRMGTTRMETNPDESVVSPRRRTHDLGDLWIAGSSVFVTSGAMNPTLTIAALALKAADHVDEML